MAKNVSAKDLLAFVSENKSLFSEATSVEDMIAQIEKTAQNETLIRKFTIGEPTEETFDAVNESVATLAAAIFDHVEPSKTSGMRRLALETEFGTFQMQLVALGTDED